MCLYTQTIIKLLLDYNITFEMNVLVQCYVLVSMIIDIISTDMVW